MHAADNKKALPVGDVKVFALTTRMTFQENKTVYTHSGR